MLEWRKDYARFRTQDAEFSVTGDRVPRKGSGMRIHLMLWLYKGVDGPDYHEMDRSRTYTLSIDDFTYSP